MTNQRFHELARKILGGELGFGTGLDAEEQRELLDEFCLLRELVQSEIKTSVDYAFDQLVSFNDIRRAIEGLEQAREFMEPKDEIRIHHPIGLCPDCGVTHDIP